VAGHDDSARRDANRPIQADAAASRPSTTNPDAIQVATAIQSGATLAITNDDAWQTLPVIETVILSDLIE
jgi:hypothetical protein